MNPVCVWLAIHLKPKIKVVFLEIEGFLRELLYATSRFTHQSIKFFSRKFQSNRGVQVVSHIDISVIGQDEIVQPEMIKETVHTPLVSNNTP